MAIYYSGAHAGTALGRAIEHTISADFQDDFDWDFVSPDGLSTREAWELATRWLPHLSGQAHFAEDSSNEPFSIAPRIEWLFVCLSCRRPDDSHQRAMAARATVLTWRALAACRSFGVDNKGFWRRVAWELRGNTCERLSFHRPKGYVQEVTDDCFFFDGVTFPRVRLSISDERVPEEVQVFCGLMDSNTCHEDISRHLDEALNRLAGLLNTSAVSTPPIELLVTNSYSFDHTFSQLVAEVNTRSEFSIKHVHASTRSDWSIPSMPLPIAYSSVCTIDSDDEFEELLKLRSQLLDLIRNLDEFGDGLHHLSIYHDRPDCPTNNALEAVCSALPHIRALRTVEIKGKRCASLSNASAAWLGYAMFHPNTLTSLWSRLAIIDTSFESPSPVWEMMSKGNNLPTVLRGPFQLHQVDAYYFATIRAGATIFYDKPLVAKRIVEVLDTDTTMDALVASTNMADLDEWTAVVVVGFGEAWVHSSEIIEIESRPPGRLSLSALFIRRSWWAESSKLIELIGEQLTYLNVTGLPFCEGGDTTSLLSTIRQSCPRITSLAVAVSCPEDISLLPPSLCELDLYVDYRLSTGARILFPCHRSPASSLSNLWVLFISTKSNPTDEELIDSCHNFAHAHPRLQTLSWVYTSTGGCIETAETRLDYTQCRYISRSVLCQRPGLDCVVLGDQAPSESLVALLSVIKFWSHHGGGFSGNLDRDIMLYIGAFVGRNEQQNFWFDGYGKSSFTPDFSSMSDY